jgi:hypothetical protein
MRSYGEVVDVRTARPGTEDDGTGTGAAAAPEQFLWRGRLYLVREVLAHWIELGSWWVAPGRPRSTGSTGASTATGSVAVDVGAVEREVWRVEAAPGRSATVGVYDLVRDIPAALPAHPGHEPDDPTAPGMRPGGHRPDVPSRWRLARSLD